MTTSNNTDLMLSENDMDLLALSLLKRYKKLICGVIALLCTLGTVEYKVLNVAHETELDRTNSSHQIEIHQIQLEMKSEICIYKLKNEHLEDENKRKDEIIETLKREVSQHC